MNVRQTDLKRCRSERGASLMDYGIIVALILVIAIAAIPFLGNQTADSLCDAGDEITDINSPCSNPAATLAAATAAAAAATIY